MTPNGLGPGESTGQPPPGVPFPDCFQPGEGGCCARKGSKAGVTAVQGLILGFAGVETQRRLLIRETANPGELFCSIEIQQEPGLCLERQSLI